MARYRHKPSGGILTTDREMPSSEWELIDGPDEADEPDKAGDKPKRPAKARKAATAEE